MFFNKGKLTNHAPKTNCTYEFTDNFCRNVDPKDYEGIKTLSDKLCKNLRLVISLYGNHSYHYKAQGVCKVIGSVYQISIKDARKIAQNINENKEEFKKEAPKIKMPLYIYFQKFGEYPHQPKGTEVVISNENSSLKEKIKELQTENAVLLSQVNELKGTNELLQKKLKSIEDIVLFNELPEKE